MVGASTSHRVAFVAEDTAMGAHDKDLALALLHTKDIQVAAKQDVACCKGPDRDVQSVVQGDSRCHVDHHT